MKKSLSRKELYDLVWAEPRKTLAKKFGVSDVWIGKTCRKAGIPVPERGHWAKKRSGKKVFKPMLPPRFPGAEECIGIGSHRGETWSSDLMNSPLPPQPIFDEDIEDVKLRITKMVGKVAYPITTTKTHPVIKKVLEVDAQIIKERDENRYTWLKPLFESPVEKRRLRLLNAIFLAAQGFGCKSYMTTSKYEVEKEKGSATIHVGDQSVKVTINIIKPKSLKNKKSSKENEVLSLSISGWNGEKTQEYTWEDNIDLRLEKSLTDIVINLLVAAEILYRERMLHHHKWLVQRKAELEERERKRILDEERKALELMERQEEERVNRLLADADALHKAEVIRNYVADVLEVSGSVVDTSEDVEKWAVWALEQADRIDPLKNNRFLSFCSSDLI